MATAHSYNLKLLMLGSQQVGKTNLINQFFRKTFENSYIPTIYVDIAVRTFQLDGVTIKSQCWDTTGNVGFSQIIEHLFKGADGAILVYDVTDDSTFHDLPTHLGRAKRLTSVDTQIILVGNKCDLIEQRKVSFETAKEFADTNNLPYFELSTKSYEQVEFVFTTLASMILETETRKRTLSIPVQNENSSLQSRLWFCKCNVL